MRKGRIPLKFHVAQPLRLARRDEAMNATYATILGLGALGTWAAISLCSALGL